jgi:hypothetical protein
MKVGSARSIRRNATWRAGKSQRRNFTRNAFTNTRSSFPSSEAIFPSTASRMRGFGTTCFQTRRAISKGALSSRRILLRSAFPFTPVRGAGSQIRHFSMRSFSKVASWSRLRRILIASSVLIAEFTSFSKADYPEPQDFFEELDIFLNRLPKVLRLAVFSSTVFQRYCGLPSSCETSSIWTPVISRCWPETTRPIFSIRGPEC